jgi:hypothetical protein
MLVAREGLKAGALAHDVVMRHARRETLEGRYTLQELFARLRRGGYLSALNINAQNPTEALEQLVTYLGGESAIKFYHIVDLRDFLEKVKGLKLVKPPKPKAR